MVAMPHMRWTKFSATRSPIRMDRARPRTVHRRRRRRRARLRRLRLDGEGRVDAREDAREHGPAAHDDGRRATACAAACAAASMHASVVMSPEREVFFDARGRPLDPRRAAAARRRGASRGV